MADNLFCRHQTAVFRHMNLRLVIPGLEGCADVIGLPANIDEKGADERGYHEADKARISGSGGIGIADLFMV